MIIKKFFKYGSKFVSDPFHKDAERKNQQEQRKQPRRTDIINYLLGSLNRETTYLEIGVRYPEDNFNHIQADKKYSVDPGVEYKKNPVDFKVTSDSFFEQLKTGQILSKDIKFDVIFIDGLHLAEQVNKDVINSLEYIKDDGFIVLHDCNPPTEWHAREEYGYMLTPALGYWNGTTWKAFVKWRTDASVYSCCIDTDWGVGILSKKQQLGQSTALNNPFFEFGVFDSSRKESLNLISFEDLKKLVPQAK